MSVTSSLKLTENSRLLGYVNISGFPFSNKEDEAQLSHSVFFFLNLIFFFRNESGLLFIPWLMFHIYSIICLHISCLYSDMWFGDVIHLITDVLMYVF